MYNKKVIPFLMFPEGHKLIKGDWFPNFGVNFFSGNMKILDFIYLESVIYFL